MIYPHREEGPCPALPSGLASIRAGIGGIGVLSLVNTCLTAVFPGMVEQLVFMGRRLCRVTSSPSISFRMLACTGGTRWVLPREGLGPGIDNESDQVP